MTRGAARVPLISMLVLAASAGCAFQQKKVEQQLANPPPINCGTARGDLRMLRQEKATVVERIAEGVTSIYPAGLVIGVVSGTESTNLQVAIGDYNDEIDQRIAAIEQTCGIQ